MLTSRKLKAERRRRRWEAFRRRRHQLSFDDVPVSERPHMGPRSIGACMVFRSVENWPLSEALLGRVKGKGHEIRCSLSMSFFDCASRRFFGGTWMGRGVEPSSSAGRHGKGRKKKDISSAQVLTSEVLYWSSRVEDPACIAIIELVASETTTEGHILGQYGCGWTYLHLHRGDDLGVDATVGNDHTEYRTIPIYDGTPRCVVMAAKKLEVSRSQFDQTEDGGLAFAAGSNEIPGSCLEFKLRRHDGLLRCAHLLADDEVVTADDLVPGLAPFAANSNAALKSNRHYDDESDSPVSDDWLALPPTGRRISSRRPMLGLITQGDENNVVPVPWRPRLAPEITLQLTELRVKIHRREKLEQTLLQYLGFQGDSQHKGIVKREKIVARRLALGLHNGRALTMRRSTPDGFVRLDLSRCDGDVLAASDGSTMTLPGFTKHALHAIIAMLEYEVRPLQHVDKNASPKTFTVRLGAKAYLPFDGTKLRLRAGTEPRYIELELEADDTCRDLSSCFVWPPSANDVNAATADGSLPGDDFNVTKLAKKYSKGKLLGFELRALESTSVTGGRLEQAREVPDDTPDRTSDQSSDEESVVDDDDLGDGEFNDEDSDDECKLDDEHDNDFHLRRRSPRKKKKTKRLNLPPSDDDEDFGQDDIPFADDASHVSSLVSGDWSRNKLRAAKKKRNWDGMLSYGQEEAARWRVAAPLQTSSLLTRTLQAPLHRGDGIIGGAFPAAGPCVPTAASTAAVGGGAAVTDDLSRAQRARLSRHGYPTELLAEDERHRKNLVPEQGMVQRYDLRLEATDPLARHELTIQFAAFRAPENMKTRPRAIYCTFQFYNLAPTRTERLRLSDGSRSDSTYMLVRDRGDSGEPPMILKYIVDTSASRPNEGRLFAEYLASKTMYIDVWDAESRLHVGVVAVPLDRLLRQRSPAAKFAAEHAVILPDGMVDSGMYATEANATVTAVSLDAAAIAGQVVGHLQIVMCNYGEYGVNPAKQEDSEDDEKPESNTLEALDWRRHASTAKSLDASSLRSTIMRGAASATESALRNSYGSTVTLGKGPRHRVRAKPLTETSSELSTLLASRGEPRRGGLFSAAKRRERLSEGRPVASGEANSVTYDELLQMVRRFRDGKGRINYSGPLLALLEAPNLKTLEAQLIRVLSRAENNGTTLERAFACFDADRGGTVSAVELEDALRALGCFRGASTGSVGALLRKFDADGDGVISLSEFIRYIRDKQAESKPKKIMQRSPTPDAAALEARLKALLLRAEALGVSVVDAFKQFDLDGNGQLTESEFARALQALTGACDKQDRDSKKDSLTESEVHAFFLARDSDGNGTIDVGELLALAGRSYTDHLVLKLKRILDDVEAKGTRVADAFAAWDSDHGGTLSRIELERGLRSLGILEHMHEADVGRLLDRLDADGSGAIDVKELYAFVGRDYGEFLEARLKTIFAVAQRDFNVPLDAAFREWDADKEGTVSSAELKKGLERLGVFTGTSPEDVSRLLSRLDTDHSGEVSLREFLRFLGCDLTAVLAQRLRAVLFNAEKRGSNLDAVFAEWDADDGGTISHAEFKAGLLNLGPFAKDLRADGAHDIDAQIDLLVQRYFDKDNDGSVSKRELYVFMGRDPAAVIEGKLRTIVHSSGIGAQEAFKHFDKDSDGEITTAELATGLRELPGFEGVTQNDAERLAVVYDLNGDGTVSKPEFCRQVGESPEVGEAERRITSALRSAVQTKTKFGVGKAALAAALTYRGSRQRCLVNEKALRQWLYEDLEVSPDIISNKDIEILFKRLAKNKSGITEKCLKTFCSRAGILTPAEIAIDHGEPAVSPALAYSDAKRDPALERFGKLLVTLEDALHGNLSTALSKLDTDGSGAVSAMELYEGLSNLSPDLFGPRHWTPADAARVLHRLDEDHSGSLELAELKAFAADFRASTLSSKTHTSSKKKKSASAEIVKVTATLRAVLRKAESSGASLRDAFTHFDTDGNNRLSPREITRCLRSLSPELFDDVSEAQIRELIRAEFDEDGDGEVDVGEFISFVRHSPKEEDSREDCSGAPNSELVKETLRAILLRTEQLGTSLSESFGALDEDDSGRISVKEMLHGLKKLGVFEKLDKSAVELLVREELDDDGSGNIDLDEFLHFARGNSAIKSSSTQKVRESAKEEEEDLEIVSKDYEFALDPDTRAVEKKLRRAARQLTAHGGDVRQLFEQYDTDRTGTVIRSDFVQVIMQLGLALVDAEVSEDAGATRALALRDPSNTALRKRQMMQLAKVRKGFNAAQFKPSGVIGPRLLAEKHRGTENDLIDDWDELELVKWYREGYKRDMVRSLLAKAVVKRVAIFPSFGQTCWFEHTIRNPFSRAERVSIHISVSSGEATDKEVGRLRVVTNAEEWSHLRRTVSPEHGKIGSGPVEGDMLDASGPAPVVMLMANENVRIPFAYLSLEPPSHDLRWGPRHRPKQRRQRKDECKDDNEAKNQDGDEEELPRAVTTVKFVAAGGFVLAILEIESFPRACVVDRTFRFYQPEGEMMKRCVRILPPRPGTNAALSSIFTNGFGSAVEEQSGLYVHCVPTARGSDVSLSWRPSESVPGAHEVRIKYARVGAFPSVGEFYVLVFKDRFCASLAELWYCVVHSRLRADANGVAGQAAGVELVVRGDRVPRVVRAYAGLATSDGSKEQQANDAAFDPPSAFRLVPNAHNKFAVHFRPRHPGNARLHVHLVDVDTQDLVAAWLLNAVAAAPTITKTYDVEVPLGQAITKRIPYRNPWNKARTFTMVSSDETLVRARDPARPFVNIGPSAVEYLRLYFAPVHRQGLVQCYLFLNDENDQSEETFLLRLLVA